MAPPATAPRRFLLCPPTAFDVVYAINPWMDPSRPTDADRAVRQWEGLVAALTALGHTVELVEPLEGQPDMVFCANAAVVHRGRAVGARFLTPHRQPEVEAYNRWLRSHGYEVLEPRSVLEGAGDVVTAPSPSGGAPLLFCGWGQRSAPEAAGELSAFLGLETVSLELVDPRFYHLDTALNVVSSTVAMVVPAAFTTAGLAEIRARFATVLELSEADAGAFGANAVSDGAHVLLDEDAADVVPRLESLGFEPVRLPSSELRKGGGSLRCCVLELT